MSYYKILELADGASAHEVKQAYRRLAMKWHPDRNSNTKIAEEKFKQIKQAYESLSVPGYTYIPNPAYYSTPKPPPPQYKKPQHFHHIVVNAVSDANVIMSLSETYTGKLVHASKKTLCSLCNGTGAKDVFPRGSIGDTVWTAKGYGRGHESEKEASSNICKNCAGAGEVVEFSDHFAIPSGIPDGAIISLQRSDSLGRPIFKGSKNIKVHVTKDMNFDYSNGHLYMTIKVSNHDLLEGFCKRITLPNGRCIEAQIPKILEDGITVRIADVGPPNLNTGEPGHLYIKLHKII